MILNGVVEGEGDGLVLLHPIGLDHTFWSPLTSALTSRQRILRLDLRGHGNSTALDRRPPIRTFADDVYETIRHFGLEKPTVLGVSFGGMVAQTLALAYPDAVSRLILCACPGGIPQEAREHVRERGLVAERDGIVSIVPATIERWFNADFFGESIVQQVRERLLANDASNWSDGWHAIAGFCALPELNAVQVPTLVVAGEFDKATSREASIALADAIPGTKLEVIAGAPHMLQLETAAALARTVEGFLGCKAE